MLKESWKKILLGALLLTGLTMLLGSDSSDKKADSLLAMPKAEAAAMPAYEQEYMKIVEGVCDYLPRCFAQPYTVLRTFPAQCSHLNPQSRSIPPLPRPARRCGRQKAPRFSGGSPGCGHPSRRRHRTAQGNCPASRPPQGSAQSP